MACDPQYKTLRDRLETYGLVERELHGVDITVEPNQTLVLSGRDAHAAGQIVHLRPRTAHDLKRWIGIPEHAVQTSAAMPASATRAAAYTAPHRDSLFVPQVRFGREDRDLQAHLSTFLFRRAPEGAADEVAMLDRYLERAGVGVSVFLANDIYVAGGARLIVDAKIQVLFARYITVAWNGHLSMNSPIAKIDCAGLRGQSQFVHPSTTATHGGASVGRP